MRTQAEVLGLPKLRQESGHTGACCLTVSPSSGRSKFQIAEAERGHRLPSHIQSSLSVSLSLGSLWIDGAVVVDGAGKVVGVAGKQLGLVVSSSTGRPGHWVERARTGNARDPWQWRWREARDSPKKHTRSCLGGDAKGEEHKKESKARERRRGTLRGCDMERWTGAAS